eukprot:8515401-Prorocentrum_lima.AAC.1
MSCKRENIHNACAGCVMTPKLLDNSPSNCHDSESGHKCTSLIGQIASREVAYTLLFTLMR